MQKQAAFWLAISIRPEVLILDEPVDGLDPVMRRQVWQLLLSDVSQNGTTVLVSSHNLRELEDVCDRVGIVDHGRMLLERSLSELQENIVKVQMVPAEGNGLPDGLKVVHQSQAGRLLTLVVRGSGEEIRATLEAASPVYFDLLPLSLEEIFIYELGGVSHEIRQIIL
ncbi:MAG: AAA family ATPase [Oscillospiraceae bacterium]